MTATSDAGPTYAGYLRLDTLLDLQHPLGGDDLPPPARAAEHFFIVVHQAFELWFKQQLLDLRHATDALAPPQPKPERALGHLRRVAAIQEVLNTQMTLLNQMAFADFHAFRDALGEASGQDSPQAREIRGLLGMGGGAHGPVYAAFAAALAAAGLTVEDVYRDPERGGAYARIAETLLDIAEGIWLMYAAHVRITERAIGDLRGTGGSSGTEALANRLSRRTAFAELIDVRRALAPDTQR